MEPIGFQMEPEMDRFGYRHSLKYLILCSEFSFFWVNCPFKTVKQLVITDSPLA